MFFLEHGVHPGHALGGGQRLRLHGSSITGVGYDRKALPFTLTLQAAGLSSDEARSALGSNPISMKKIKHDRIPVLYGPSLKKTVPKR